LIKRLKILSGLAALIALSTFFVLNAAAQEVTFKGSAKSDVRQGEQFRLTYTVNSNASGFVSPRLEGFRVLSGPNQSSNRSYQIINGQVTQSFQLTYTYFLQAMKEGEFNIPPARINVSGKEYSSNPVKIKVGKGQNPGNPVSNTSGQSSGEGGITKDDVYIKALVNKRNPFQGEQIIITYKIYTTVPISQIEISKLSSFPGFWYKDLKDNNESLRQYNERIGGKDYVVAELRKIALFPQRNGKITIDPMEMECQAQVRVQNSSQSRDPFFDSFFDDPFFNRNVRNIPIKLTSNPIDLEVKPLPSGSMSATFGGAVGQFQLRSTLDRTVLKANEAITLKAIISGKGNIELIDELKFAFPPDFEVYDPKVSNQISKSSSGISGSRTFEYLMIPRSAGEFTIRPAAFTYFDHQKNQYITLSTPEYKITVEKSDDEPAGISYSGISQKDIQYIGSDIRHIITTPFKLHQINSFFYLSDLFYLLLIIPVVLFIILILIWRKRVKLRQDTTRLKNKKATRIARKNLKLAGQFLKDREESKFYEEVSRALWGYISDKFNIPLSELSMENVSTNLKGKNVQQETTEEFTTVLNNCEYARFAPGSSSDKMNDLYEQAIKIIERTEREIR